MSNEFWNENHEDLFKLFILVSNGRAVESLDGECFSVRSTDLIFPFQFNDRDICEEELEGWIANTSHMNSFTVYFKKHMELMSKIKYRFVQED